MSAPLALFLGSREIDNLLATYGYVIVFLIVSAESLGLLLPGETTLTLAAIYAGSTHQLSIAGVIAAAAAGAIVGDNLGYWLGSRLGYGLMYRYGRYVHVDERRLKIGRLLADRHGGKVVFLGRFVTVLRAYAAFLAGTTRMRWRTFLVYNAAGGIAWAALYGLGFYYFGSAVSGLQTDIGIAVVAVALVAFFSAFVWLRHKEQELGDEAERAYPDLLRVRRQDAA